jgi:hypothetical protein
MNEFEHFLSKVRFWKKKFEMGLEYGFSSEEQEEMVKQNWSNNTRKAMQEAKTTSGLELLLKEAPDRLQQKIKEKVQEINERSNYGY